MENCGYYLDENIDSMYSVTSFTTYSIMIITYDITNVFLNETQLALINNLIKYIRTITTTFSSENLFIQTLKKTKQKELVLEAQQLLYYLQYSLVVFLSSVNRTVNESDPSIILETLVTFEQTLMSLGIVTLFVLQNNDYLLTNEKNVTNQIKRKPCLIIFFRFFSSIPISIK